MEELEGEEGRVRGGGRGEALDGGGVEDTDVAQWTRGRTSTRIQSFTK